MGFVGVLGLAATLPTSTTGMIGMDARIGQLLQAGLDCNISALCVGAR